MNTTVMYTRGGGLKHSKLLAALAVLVMVACAIAVVAPAADAAITTSDDGKTATVTTSDELQTVLAGIDDSTSEYYGVTTILLGAEEFKGIVDQNNTSEYVKYIVDQKVTIRAASGFTPEVYGGFSVIADGVVFDGITILPDGEGGVMKTAIAAYVNDITIRNCTFSLVTENEALANGINLYPKSDEFTFTVTGNTFNGFLNKNTSGYGSVAFTITSAYGINAGTGNYFTGTSVENETSVALNKDAMNDMAIAVATGNTFNNNYYNFAYSDNTGASGYDPTGTYVPGVLDDDFSKEGDVVIIVPGQTIGVEKSFSIAGDLIVMGTLNVPAGTTVTVNGQITIQQNATVNVNGNMDVVNGTMMNGGTVNASSGKLSIASSSMLYAAPGSTTNGIVSNNASSNIVAYTGATVSGVVKSDGTEDTVTPKDGVYEAADFSALRNAINSGIENISVPTPITINADLEIPFGTTVTFGTATNTGAEYDSSETVLTVAAGVTYIVAGEAEVYGGVVVEEGATLIVETELTADSMQIAGAFENTGLVNVTGMIDVTATGSVENAGDMYLGDASNVDGTFENSGAVGAYNDAKDVAITGDGTFNNLTGGVVGFPVNTKVVTGVSYDVTMTQDITQSTTFGSLQNVIVPEGAVLTVQRTATLTINGTLTVLGTLNVEGQLVIASAAGAQLVIDGTVNVNTNGNNQGKIVIGMTDEPGYATVNNTLNVTDGSAVEVAANSALVINGNMTLQAGATLKSDATNPVAALPEIGNKDAVPASGVVVSTDANLQISGDLVGSVAIRNYGNIVVDNSASDAEAPGSIKVLMGSSDATVTLTSFRLVTGAGANSFEVSDAGIIFKDRTRNDVAIDVDDNKVNSIVFKAGAENVVLNGGIVFTESVTSRTVGATTTYTNKLNMEGSVSAAFTGTVQNVEVGDCVDMTVTGRTAVTVTGALALGANVEMTNAGNLDVSGTVTNTATGAQPITNNGTITVTGLITASKEIVNSATINAAKYTITTGTPAVTTYNYSTLETAVPAVAAESNTATKTILIMGSVTVEENVDVPAGVTINHDRDAKLTIDKDATVTMQAGSKMNSQKEQVVVDGTLTFNDKTNDGTTKTISDVTVESEEKNGFRTYTNVYNALANASEGQTVTVTKDTGLVVLDENITVPAGVTLVVPDRAVSLYLENGVTMTVDGTLVTELTIYAENDFGTTAMNVEAATGVTAKQSSAIVVNGTLRVADDIGFAYGNNNGSVAPITGTDRSGVSIADDAPIYGAYYGIDGYTVVSTVAIASANVADIIGNVVINGPVSAGDVSFTGNDEFSGIVIGSNVPVNDMDGKAVNTVLTVSSITLVDTNVATTYGALNGDVVVGDATLTVSNVRNLTVTDDEEDGMTISGTVSVIGNDGGNLTLAAGTVVATLNSASGAVEFDVAAGATLVSEGANLNKLTVDGTVSVASGKNLIATTVVVEGNGVLSVTAATATSAAGSASIANLFLGIDRGDFEKGDNYDMAADGTATVSGPVSITGKAYVLNGAAIDAANLEGLDSIAFHLNGEVWFTVYGVSTLTGDDDTITVNKAPIENAVLAGWSATENGVAIPNGNAAQFTFVIGGDYENLYAVVNYDIYVIQLRADTNAVSSVTIDGNLMEYGMIRADNGDYYYGFTATVAAGNHTIAYQLANGYSGTGMLSVNGGTASTDMTFSTSGTPTTSSTITYNLQLTGFEKSGYVPDSPDTPSDSGSSDDGMTITDYLLIILVVLIIVMAIIVAMRLMRS